jgi:hypothetical protein
MKENIQLESQVTFLRAQLAENKKMHDGLLVALQRMNTRFNGMITC